MISKPLNCGKAAVEGNMTGYSRSESDNDQVALGSLLGLCSFLLQIPDMLTWRLQCSSFLG